MRSLRSREGERSTRLTHHKHSYFLRCLKEALEGTLGKCFAGSTEVEMVLGGRERAGWGKGMVIELEGAALVVEFETEEGKDKAERDMKEPVKILKCVLDVALSFGKVSAAAAQMMKGGVGVLKAAAGRLERAKMMGQEHAGVVLSERSMNVRIVIGGKLRGVLEDVLMKEAWEKRGFVADVRRAVEEGGVESAGEYGEVR